MWAVQAGSTRGFVRATPGGEVTRATWIMRDRGRSSILQGDRHLRQKSSEYRGYRTAGIRLSRSSCPSSAILRRTDEADAGQFRAFGKAHTVMLVEGGLLRFRGRGDLADCATESEVWYTRAASGRPPFGRAISDRFGETSGRFHLARSSGDLSSAPDQHARSAKLLALMRAVNGLRRR
jgi:argininosuccinate lyase